MKILLTLIFLGLGSAWAQEKLLDKIIAVVNTRVISLSEIERAKETLEARKEVSPIIYPDDKEPYDNKRLLNIMIRTSIIRDKISAQGYVINDDAVESRIKMTEERLGLKRSDLLIFLKQKKITYEEYFEIIRETMEYNIFASKIIAPLISVTEQEIKNEFYRRNSTNNALAFKYNLVDFYLPENKLVVKDENKFLAVLRDYQLTGRLPQDYSGLETNNLDNLSEDNLPKELSSILKNTSEGAFSRPIILQGHMHAFYVQKKDLVESAGFQQFKEQIQNDIFATKGKAVTNNWFDREYSNYYIKIIL